jgi:hypothetical protein
LLLNPQMPYNSYVPGDIMVWLDTIYGISRPPTIPRDSPKSGKNPTFISRQLIMVAHGVSICSHEVKGLRG